MSVLLSWGGDREENTVWSSNSGRAESLGELLASVRRQGVRAEGLLKDSDNLIQRYRNLSVRLQEEAQAQSLLQEQWDTFSSQLESTRAWMAELLEPLGGPERQPGERKTRAQVSEGASSSVGPETTSPGRLT